MALCIPQVTLECYISDFKVLLDGPWVVMDRDEISELRRQNKCHSTEVQLEQTREFVRNRWNSDHSKEYSQAKNKDDAEDGEKIVDVPIVCVCVEPIEHGP